ncbi:transaldolase [Georgenia sp. Z1491]|uniref:transaldolase n=1 Tax=Georgenia sp. Z1491 TaxID=3416707 RepID=UPI003CE9F108
MTDQTSPLSELSAHGVSVWLDDLSRERLDDGSLQQLIDDRNVVGVTTNPTIFAGALSKGSAYDAQVAELARAGSDVEQAVTAITTDDVRAACDVFAPVFEATGGKDGRVSIEVDPRLARDTGATIAEARTLWQVVDRPNVMIKIPATEEGLPAIADAIAEGISVNVTLIFSLDRYRAVATAYLDGLERAQDNGIDLSTIRSVASFFVSRVDAEVDKRLDALGSSEASALRGATAIANARLAYARFEEIFGSPRFTELAASGAHVQRPLWASTGVKDEAYRDTMYVEELVADDTVNTMPEKTLLATAEHGEIRGDTVSGRADQAQQVLESLAALGIDIDEVTAQLEDEGVSKFEVSWEELLQTVRSALDSASA